MPYAAIVTFTFYKHRKSYWNIIFNIQDIKRTCLHKMEWINGYKNQERHLIYYNGIQTDYYCLAITEG
jgi:hypothetical protein